MPMIPIEGAMVAQHQAAAEKERARRREEEELMTGYNPGDLQGHWQFKIVKGTFKTQAQIDAVIHEQAEYGWVLVEIFDHGRIRFKRPAQEAEKDTYREGNPYGTVSRASKPGCGTVMVLLAAIVVGGWYLIA
jgi:hypothetical protein